ncbi:MAG: MerR family DNA-binding transcriptional regulator [Rhodocyclaceae bacterium]
MATERTYSISELAREFAITPRTIRHYEDQGLLAPGRAGRARVYSRRDRTRLKLTLRGRRLGLSLAEIGEMIELYDNAPDETAQLYKFLQALSRRRAQLEQQREDIRAILEEIDAFERQCRDLLEKRGRTAQGKAARRGTGERSAA